MAIKQLPRESYIELLRIIYKFSMFNQDKGKILVYYVAFQLLNNKYDIIYLDKLQYDTNIDLRNFNPMDNLTYSKTVTQMNKTFKHIDLLEIKSIIFDVTNRGYYK